jgi:hypothetical protein
MALIRTAQIGTLPGMIQPKQIAGFAGSPLLPLYDGQFNRDNGANTSCQTAADRIAIVGGDIMRRQDRGIGTGNNFFVEPARTQYLEQTRFFPAPWAVLNGAVLTAQATLGPDSYAVHLASQVAFANNVNSQIEQTTTIGLVPINTTICFSVWAKLGTGSGLFKFQVTDHDAVNHTSAAMTTTGFWQRFSFVTVSGANAATTLVCRLMNGDATAHNVFFSSPMLEPGTEPSSYILNDTSAQSFTAPDVLQFVPGQVPFQYRALRSTGGFFCSRSSANMVVNGDRMIIRSFGDDTNTLELTSDGANVQLLAKVAGVTKAQSQNLALAEYARGGYLIDPPAGLITVNGVAGPAGTPWQWPSSTVRYGGPVGLTGTEFRGELEQEFAA